MIQRREKIQREVTNEETIHEERRSNEETCRSDEDPRRSVYQYKIENGVSLYFQDISVMLPLDKHQTQTHDKFGGK